MYSFSSGRASPPEALPIPFDLVARAFLACENLFDLEKALNFYRNGVVDLSQERYIDAVYDFYYVIEVMHANGKSGKDGVVREFLKSQSLKEAIEQTARERDKQYTIPNWEKRFSDFFNKPLDKIYKALFDLRGALHHAKNNGPNAWHPDHQQPYHFEAMLFAHLAHNVLFPKVMEQLGRQEVIDAYKGLFKQPNNKTA